MKFYNTIFFINQDIFFIAQWMPFPDTIDGRNISFLTDLYRSLLGGFTMNNDIKLCKINGDSAY